MKWSLENSCEGKFKVGDKVKTRGDMGRFELKIVEIHNNHFCKCKNKYGLGKKRHFNMNCLEKANAQST